MSALDDYIQTLGQLPPIQRFPDQETPLDPVHEPGWDLLKSHVHGCNVQSNVVMFGADPSTIWPGSVLQGGHILDPVPAGVPLARAPLTLTVTGPIPDVTANVSVDNPSTATITDAINGLLQSTFVSPGPSHADASVVQTYSLDHLARSAGLTVKYLSADVQANISDMFDTEKASFAATFLQTYYTISASEPGPGSSYFDPDVSVDDAQAYMGSDNPPVYISSVAYGRRLILLITTEMRKEDFNADIDAAVQWSDNNVHGHADMSRKGVLKNSSLRLINIGGSTGELVGFITATTGDALDSLAKYIADGATWDLTRSPGAVIGWTTKYVADVTGVTVMDLCDYDKLRFKRTCGQFTTSIHQDNSGIAHDITTHQSFPPPPRTLIDTNTVQVQPYVSRGRAWVDNISSFPDNLKFDVVTQQADTSIFFGHHSGLIDVDVSYTYCGG